jgi:hypothetical protein
VTEPAELVAVKVYVVVADGLTDLELEATTAPTPWSMLTEVAPDVVQLRVDDWPGWIDVGLAVSVAVGRPGVTVPVNSNAPMSHAPPCGLEVPMMS